METQTASVVLDIGAAATRIGFAGDGNPVHILNSSIGVRQQGPGADCPPGVSHSSAPKAFDGSELLFPLNYSECREGVQVVPALVPTWSNQGSKAGGSSNNPTYTLHEEAFETLVALGCQGLRAATRREPGVRDASGCYESGGRCGGEFYFNDHLLRLTELCGVGADLREQPLLMSEPNIHCVEIREKMAEILFEKVGLGCLYVAKRALLACVAAGRSSALVVDIGASGLSLAPVADSFVLDKRVLEWPVGGDAMSALLGSILMGHNLPVVPSFARFAAPSRTAKVPLDRQGAWDRVHPSYMHCGRMQTLATLKEGLCRVADDPRDVAAARKPLVLPNQQQQHRKRGPPAPSDGFVQSQLLSPCSSAATAAALLAGGPTEGGVLELPDGTRLGAEQVAMKLPEVLFCPSLLATVPGGGAGYPGLAEAVRQVAESVESEGNRDLLSAIILTGGCSAIPGLVERVNREVVENPAVVGGQKVRLLAAPGSLERRQSAWVGGSILASLSSFQASWCSREEYEEHGPAVVQRKCY